MHFPLPLSPSAIYSSPMALPELAYSPDRLERLRHGAAVVSGSPAVFWVEGSGALACLQGLLTNDLAKPGDLSLVYGAVLTPKGMIVADHWVLRLPDRFALVGAERGREPTRELLNRSLPPRLAKVTDATGQVEAAWLIGGQAFATLARSSLKPLPEAAGRVSTINTIDGRLALALAPEGAPFTALALGPPAAIAPVVEALLAAGASGGTAEDLDAARVLAGWPALGAEIDARTLPQEVRYDEIGGVSYTKGCYVGQETVARLHFRGHANRNLRGLLWRTAAPLADERIVAADREVGAVRSTLALDDRRIGLGMLRREIDPGTEVLAGGQRAVVLALPFAPDDLAP
jgi:folate-binding protein YgfZ